MTPDNASTKPPATRNRAQPPRVLPVAGRLPWRREGTPTVSPSDATPRTTHQSSVPNIAAPIAPLDPGFLQKDA